MIDSAVATIVGALITTLGTVIVAIIQSKNSKSSGEGAKLLLPPNVVIYRVRKYSRWYVVMAIVGGLLGYGFGALRNLETKSSVKGFLDSCIDSQIWIPYVGEEHSKDINGCWQLSDWGYSAQDSVLRLSVEDNSEYQWHGIFTKLPQNANILLAGCNSYYPPSPTPVYSFNPLPAPPTITPLVQLPKAVTSTDATCYARDIEITISPFVVVELLNKNSVGDWVQVKVNDVIVCWVQLRQLRFDEYDLVLLPIMNIPTPQIPTQAIIPIPIDTPAAETAVPVHRLLLRWKIMSYDCFNGVAVGVTVGLDVSGGIPDYRYSPKLPIYGNPGQTIVITIKSATVDGEPSGSIRFTLPEKGGSSVYQCRPTKKNQSENYLVPPPAPTDPPPSTKNHPETGRPVCYNPQGRVIPCH